MALGRTRRELLALIGSDELKEWQAYYRIEPFGEKWADYRLAFQTLNLLAKPKKDTISTDDFMPNKKPKKTLLDFKNG